MKGLYVHIPFCIKKCKYCDFNSFCASEKLREDYIGALCREMERYNKTEVDTVFVGGGTPTCLTIAQLEQVFCGIKENFSIANGAEITIEANPKTLDTTKLKTLKTCGVNRISIGVQSFDDAELKALGRVHTGDEAAETVKAAKRYFDNVSIDLMCAIPGQTAESLSKTLDRAFSLNPSHISCYSLILEEGTPLFAEYEKGLLSLPDEDSERDMYELVCRRMAENGYVQYEISNFARNGLYSRHNAKYWRCEEYIGIGLSAHSYVKGCRFSDTENIESYLRGDYASKEVEKLSEADKMSEFMFLGLRITEGIAKSDFRKNFGREIEDVFGKPLSKFKKMGMIKEENGKIRLSHEAISVSNTIMCEFIL